MNSKLIKIKKSLLDIALFSSSHGIPNIFASKKPFFKIMWTIFLLVCSRYCLYSIKQSLVSYLAWDVVTLIDIIKEVPTEFPAVTFCNLNPYSTQYAQNQLNKFIKNLNLSKDISLNLQLNTSLIHKSLMIRTLFQEYSINEGFTNEFRK